MYIKGHVETVDTKDQSNAIVYCVCYVVCQQCKHTQRRLLGWPKSQLSLKSPKSQLSKTFSALKIR